MKKTLIILILVSVAFAFNTPKSYRFNLSENDAVKIIESVKRSPVITAAEANELIEKIQRQAVDTILNPNK